MCVSLIKPLYISRIRDLIKGPCYRRLNNFSKKYCFSDESSDIDEENDLHFTVKEEPFETDEMSISQTEIQYKNNITHSEVHRRSEDTEKSLRIIIEDVVVKNEPPEWKREEDKLILEIIKQSMAEEGMKNKSVNEVIDYKSEMLSECFVGKTLDDIKERVVHLLQFVNGNK